MSEITQSSIEHIVKSTIEALLNKPKKTKKQKTFEEEVEEDSRARRLKFAKKALKNGIQTN